MSELCQTIPRGTNPLIVESCPNMYDIVFLYNIRLASIPNAKGRNAKATERQATEPQATERQGDQTPRRH